MTAYNAATPLEVDATARLIAYVPPLAAGRRPTGSGRVGGLRFRSHSESPLGGDGAGPQSRRDDHCDPVRLPRQEGAGQRRHRQRSRCASAIRASASSRFPMEECDDVSKRDTTHRSGRRPAGNSTPSGTATIGRRIGTLITEPYLGGGGSYHPQLGHTCNCSRTSAGSATSSSSSTKSNRTSAARASLFAFATYGLEPDMVVLGKGLGNGMPVAAVVGRAREIFGMPYDYGEASDTWSGNPLNCAAVLATLDELRESRDILGSRCA